MKMLADDWQDWMSWQDEVIRAAGRAVGRSEEPGRSRRPRRR